VKYQTRITSVDCVYINYLLHETIYETIVKVRESKVV